MKLIRKDRERNFIGKLKEFNDLPIKVQDDLKTVKKYLIEKGLCDIDCYIFGSYYHGFADEQSDYDVISDKNFTYERYITEELKELVGNKVDVSYINNFHGISIP